ncbi:MAG: cation:proton antiporter, partial [Methyloligellaceae bacterium]
MIESQLHLPYLRELIVFLIAAAILVPLFQKIKISPTIGFLIIGFLIGPFGLGLWVEQIGFVKYAVISEVEGVKTFAELGVIFLLFTIGLELSLRRLWAMRFSVFGLGSAQVLICGAVITAIAFAFGNTANASILIGACLALSSTAMVVQLLIENGRFSSPVGKTGFSILLFQDLAVVPIILLVGILGAKDSGGIGASLVFAIGTAAAVVLGIFIFGQIVLRPLFRLVTFRHSPEFFMAMTLLILILSSTITAMAGLSMALGAFLAGLLLAETEFRHQIEIDIEPFKGLFMGLFFMSIGMGIDLRIVWSDLYWLAISVIGLYVIKAAIITGICLVARKPLSVALPTGMLLGQGGEFAFVVIAIAMQAGIIPPDVAQFMIITASLSLISTPFVVIGAIRLMDYFADDIRGDHPYKLTDTGEELSQHVIIAGFGRAGLAIGKMLAAQQVSYAAIDRKGPLVMKMKGQGHPVIYGDSSRKEVLR